jgi:hypothetical protein
MATGATIWTLNNTIMDAGLIMGLVLYAKEAFLKKKS